jgi:ribosomal protein L11 methyltransferase
MRELVLTVPARAAETVLDRLLPLLPSGVREEPERNGRVTLRLRDPGLPDEALIRAAAGRHGRTLRRREVPEDPDERRRLDWRPELLGGRLVVRPEWAPACAEAEIELVLVEGNAFGGGSHPTTRTCLEWLLEGPAEGSFADLGCGTGVLAILAARLGYAPVVAVDLSPDAVASAAANAALNQVAIDARHMDLCGEPPPSGSTVVANVPLAVHRALARGLAGAPPQRLIVSGIVRRDAPPVIGAYADRCALTVRREQELAGWLVLELG